MLSRCAMVSWVERGVAAVAPADRVERGLKAQEPVLHLDERVVAALHQRHERADHLEGRGDAGGRSQNAGSAPRHLAAAHQVALGVLEDLVRAGGVVQRIDRGPGQRALEADHGATDRR